MALSFVTVPKPILFSKTTYCPSISNHTQQGLGRRTNSLRVGAISTSSKWEPSKVVPQADRVLVRLEQLPEHMTVYIRIHHYGEVQAGNKVLFSDINAYDLLAS
ncbi:10 kDa chaperonin 1, chloroplastic-like [Rutidosis leptorrhynchoides]|uniref:10 kDa chaperonin 1, chloroplastic-like n=1 Tax=Rutidosis leptorrhynchoides TaxID=125765 RepID=UPI003A98DCE5